MAIRGLHPLVQGGTCPPSLRLVCWPCYPGNALRRHFLSVTIDVEVFPYTRDEITAGQADPGSFIHSVMTGPVEVLA